MVRVGGVLLGGILCWLPAASWAIPVTDPPPDRSEKRAEVAAEEQAGDADEQPPVDFHFRLRGRFLDGVTDLGDVGVQRLSAWSDTRVGERVQIRATYDVGETRVHDLWVQYDLGRGVRLRAGRSAPLWLAEFTDAPFGFQMVSPAHGAALTWPRETGVFLFVDRGVYTGRLHLVNGSGWEPDENGFKDVVVSLGRAFDLVGWHWKLDAGHYEGREGETDHQQLKRQTAIHLDGVLGSRHTFRTAVYRHERDGGHVGGFARYRRRLTDRIWAGLEIGGETIPVGAPHHEGEEEEVTGTHRSYFVAGLRYELPWTLTYVAADYRRRYGAVNDHEVLLVLQWILDFKNPSRN